MRVAFLLSLLALQASADPLSPTLSAQPAGDNLVLRLEGKAELPRAISDWAPVVEVEYLFVPLRVERARKWLPGGLHLVTTRVVVGNEVSIGLSRARILSDAVEDNPPYLEARPFVVAGQFSGIYRARLVLDPARQSLRLRSRQVPAVAVQAETQFGQPGDFARQSREMRLAVEDDAATLGRLARDLQEMWDRWRTAPRAGAGWSTDLADWRARFDVLPSRNERRPVHAIVEFLPAARSALAEGYEAMTALSVACDRAMALPTDQRRGNPVVEEASRRAHDALLGVDRAAGRREPGPDPERFAAALAILRRAATDLRKWHGEAIAKHPGHAASDWSAFRARFEEYTADALFEAGRASPPACYNDLAAVARLLVADLPGVPGRNPSLLSAYASRILKETVAPMDEGWLRSCEDELASRLGRVEKALETK